LPDAEEHRDPAGWSLAELKRLAVAAVGGRDIRVVLFGSRARGTAGRFADIDLALDAGDGPVPLEILVALRESVERSRIPFRVDLVDLHGAGPELRASVEEEGQVWIG
jgi:predicted nucleotidyltransferase